MNEKCTIVLIFQIHGFETGVSHEMFIQLRRNIDCTTGEGLDLPFVIVYKLLTSKTELTRYEVLS